MPLYGFVFLVALGVDSNIFLMSRAREESLEHGVRVGILRALVTTGGVITSAGVVLAATFVGQLGAGEVALGGRVRLGAWQFGPRVKSICRGVVGISERRRGFGSHEFSSQQVHGRVPGAPAEGARWRDFGDRRAMAAGPLPAMS